MSKGITEAEIEAAFAGAEKAGLCRLGTILKEHPALEPRVMDVVRYDGSTVSRVLKGLGLTVSRDVVNKHRRGLCACSGRNAR